MSIAAEAAVSGTGIGSRTERDDAAPTRPLAPEAAVNLGAPRINRTRPLASRRAQPDSLALQHDTPAAEVARLEEQAHELASRCRWVAAARALMRAARLQPHDANRWLQIASWQKRNRNFQAATRTLHTALRLTETESSTQSPSWMRLWQALAEVQLEAGQWDECALTCRTLLRMEPRHHAALEMLATALLYKGHVEDAAETLRALLYLSPRDPLHRLKLATLLHLQGRLGEAVREFERVVNLSGEASWSSEALEAIEALDRAQMQQILQRASQSPDFRRLARRNLNEALREDGVYLSDNGREALRHLLWDGRPDEISYAAAPRIH